MKPVAKHAWTLLAFVLANAANADTDREPRERHAGPPPVAIEACAAAVEGDGCSFEGRHGDTLSGTCEVSDSEALACRPEGAPPRLHWRDADSGQKKSPH